MFPYVDPTLSGLLTAETTLSAYRSMVHEQYLVHARTRNSAFSLVDAFSTKAQRHRVPWIAFPRNVNRTLSAIDQFRLELQEEYVEWSVEHGHLHRVTHIVFTTEFPEYYEAFAATGWIPLQRAIQAVYPASLPTAEECFGPNFTPDSARPMARARQFRKHLADNPWVNGRSGIICLAHPSNTLGALFGLVGACALPRLDVTAESMCAAVAGACVQGRNSDPSVCTAVQGLALAGHVLTLADPVGIVLEALGGIWKIGGHQIDINDHPAWRILRNGRRAILDIADAMTLDDEPIRFGAQVAATLRVSATVISEAAADVPLWARAGQESTRAIA